ncbi:hypothetical protein GCM10010466_27470 [Planomonospora alba]|uniref:HTH marR-type domain-containing protein n=1 Tax=Planomonospora alba TaxID=161354 RepID=A0ABP6N3B9_9ACTN
MTSPAPTPPAAPRPGSVPPSGPSVLGTRLRHLLESLDADISALYADLGLAGFRPRYTLAVRTLAASGPLSIRDLARATGVTHSAASQTVAQLAKEGLVAVVPGRDARHRIVHLTPEAEALLPVLEAEWAATAAAAAEFEAELSFPLSRLLEEAIEALDRRPMRRRIADAAPDLLARARARGAAGSPHAERTRGAAGPCGLCAGPAAPDGPGPSGAPEGEGGARSG